MTATGTVIGCVWAAHRLVQAEDPDVTYDWCEAAYRAYGLAKLADCRNRRGMIPEAIASHLRIFRANGWQPLPRPHWRDGLRPLVCSVCSRSIATAGVCIDGVYYCPEHEDGPHQLALAL